MSREICISQCDFNFNKKKPKISQFTHKYYKKKKIKIESKIENIFTHFKLLNSEVKNKTNIFFLIIFKKI